MPKDRGSVEFLGPEARHPCFPQSNLPQIMIHGPNCTKCPAAHPRVLSWWFPGFCFQFASLSQKSESPDSTAVVISVPHGQSSSPARRVWPPPPLRGVQKLLLARIRDLPYPSSLILSLVVKVRGAPAPQGKGRVLTPSETFLRCSSCNGDGNSLPVPKSGLSVRHALSEGVRSYSPCSQEI